MAYLSGKIVRKKCPVLVGFKRTGEAVLITCGKWSCIHCSRRNARKWGKRTFAHISDSTETWWMITLTFGASYKAPRRAFAVLPRLWDALRKDMKRNTRDGWQYLAFVEGQAKTRGGMPHFHIISNREPPIKRGKYGQFTLRGLHDWAVKRGFGFEAHIRRVDSKLGAWYVSKYASKGDDSMPRGFRRVRPVRGWAKLPVDPERKLIVPSKGESLVHFMLRVNEATDVDIDVLYERWSQAQSELKLKNDDNDS